VIPQAVWAELSGAEILSRQLAGELPAPPLHHLTGLRLTKIGHGTAEVAMPASEWLASPARRLQGGTIAMLADFAMLAAVATTTAAGKPVLLATGSSIYLPGRPASLGKVELSGREDPGQ
jgi:acyl-coenzyme A thioesterase PaaI-like protein